MILGFTVSRYMRFDNQMSNLILDETRQSICKTSQ